MQGCAFGFFYDFADLADSLVEVGEGLFGGVCFGDFDVFGYVAFDVLMALSVFVAGGVEDFVEVFVGFFVEEVGVL